MEAYSQSLEPVNGCTYITFEGTGQPRDGREVIFSTTENCKKRATEMGDGLKASRQDVLEQANWTSFPHQSTEELLFARPSQLPTWSLFLLHCISIQG